MVSHVMLTFKPSSLSVINDEEWWKCSDGNASGGSSTHSCSFSGSKSADGKHRAPPTDGTQGTAATVLEKPGEACSRVGRDESKSVMMTSRMGAGSCRRLGKTTISKKSVAVRGETLRSAVSVLSSEGEWATASTPRAERVFRTCSCDSGGAFPPVSSVYVMLSVEIRQYLSL
jgi:hypothetical protein